MRKQEILPFLITETGLYAVFMTLDLLGRGEQTIVLKYAGILLCVLFSIVSAYRGGEKLLPFALLFTAAADWFLLVLDRYYMTGIFFFLLVQSIYLFYLYRETGKLWLPVRAAFLPLVVVLLGVTGLFSPENLEAGFYFSLILVNMSLSWTRKGRRARLFSAGLSLFVLCDLCVGLHNLSWLIPDGLAAFTRIGMWLFYLPSQVLITLSMSKWEETR